MATAFRPQQATKQKWYGNFIQGHDTFDHQFFKKSPREAASMDPQQRIMLQTAYQAVEQSGYFTREQQETDVGCYIGVVSTDYQHNVACHDPNAYSATGNLGSFIAGKISHHFGWHGPAIVLDTACSSSAVAIHLACRAIISGECKQALAGGALVITSPLWFQNLAGASFLSTTGPCKPFDDQADGYCRGEGVAAVMLKRASDAIRDGDVILGYIAATGVRQNDSCTPIVVPNVPSLSGLFQSVVAKSELKPQDISLVEAHGTGTAVGDPAEWESIRTVLAIERASELIVGSVKGHIGHTESVSGLAALIKVLLMMYHGAIVPQASFTKLSRRIQCDDKMGIVTSMKSWKTERPKAALVANYGASGSNAAFVVVQPSQASSSSFLAQIGHVDTTQPFCIRGSDEAAVRRNADRLLLWLMERPSIRPSDLAFSLARQTNPALARTFAFNASTVDGIQDALRNFIQTEGDLFCPSPPTTGERPVILCFGGQISTSIGIDRSVYLSCRLFRKHLDACNDAARTLGLDSVLSVVFNKEPVDDLVQLQVALFAVQYACAQSWIDSGVSVKAVVGHSFGELSALCISGRISLIDAVKLISRRAALIRDQWGAEKGAMLALEASSAAVEHLLETCTMQETPVTVACHNAATSFTLAGSHAAIQRLKVKAVELGMRCKHLNVTHAFHSSLVDPLVPDLETLLDGIQLLPERIHLEHCTPSSNSNASRLDKTFVARHLREPVFFHAAIQRLAERFPSAVFLEAGSNSTVTDMAKRALGRPIDMHFQAINLTKTTVLAHLSEVTVSLWKAGVARVRDWRHHTCQSDQYTPLLLPPYQFAASRHWLELKQPPASIQPNHAPTANLGAPREMFVFEGFQDAQRLIARYRVITSHHQYQKYVAGHIIAQTAAICPATLEIDLVIESLRHLRPDLATAEVGYNVVHVDNQAPICYGSNEAVWLELRGRDPTFRHIEWTIFSTKTDRSTIAYVVGELVVRRADDAAYVEEWARYERLITHESCTAILNDTACDEVIAGRNLYRSFAPVVEYSTLYQHLKKVVGRGTRSVGHVVGPPHSGTWFGPVVTDCFAQAAGIWVNCMTDIDPSLSSSCMYIANAIERWLRAPRFVPEAMASYHVLATHQKQQGGRVYCTDVFVFDADSGRLLEVILGIRYRQVPINTMQDIMRRLADVNTTSTPHVSSSSIVDRPAEEPYSSPAEQVGAVAPSADGPSAQPEATPPSDILSTLKTIISELCGVQVHAIRDTSLLSDLGIDSLMAIELLKEIETVFTIKIPEEEALAFVDLPGLVDGIQSKVGSSRIPVSDGFRDPVAVPLASPSITTTAVTSSSTSSTSSKLSSESPFRSDTSISSTTPTSPLPAMDSSTWTQPFEIICHQVDDGITQCGFASYLDTVNQRLDNLCVLYIIEALGKLGSDLRDLRAGDVLPNVKHIPSQGRLTDFLLKTLHTRGLLDQDYDSSKYLRSQKDLPDTRSEEMLAAVLRDYPDHADSVRLLQLCGSSLADVIQGKQTGVRLMFSDQHGRDLLAKLYGSWPLNRMFYGLMAKFIEIVSGAMPPDGRDEPFRILEVGAGTGGTTRVLLPALADLAIPVEYTFTDLAPTLVAAAKKTFEPYSSFMRFRTHDISKPPAADMLAAYDLIIASNAVHATSDLVESTRNLRTALRPGGALLMLEMTTPVLFIDLIFGLFEGWWLFNDNRTHAVLHQDGWKKVLQQAGFQKVLWTDGEAAANTIERLILAIDGGETGPPHRSVDIERYIHDFSTDWVPPSITHTSATFAAPALRSILLTGASGSLGCHIAAQAAAMPDVYRVICINRLTHEDPTQRQQAALQQRGIHVTPTVSSKIVVLGSELSKPRFGLNNTAWNALIAEVTDICHNAWPMSARLPLSSFEPQFQTLRNVIDIATSIASLRPVGFQFISSIAVVGYYPLQTGNIIAPETLMQPSSVLPNGYGEAKYVCERILEQTLLQHPKLFKAMIVRPGQIAGSRETGIWNRMEHLSFVVKSCQTIGALPDLHGTLAWTPVEDVAGTCLDLLLGDNQRAPHAVYQIDNPCRQPWREMIRLWSEELGVNDIVSFQEWIRRVRTHKSSEADNPAVRLIGFLEEHFQRMSCGGLVMDTRHAVAHSATLAAVRSVSGEVARRYIRVWRDSGFLS